LIQGVDDKATLALLPYVHSVQDGMKNLPAAESVLNKFCYTSGCDANQVGSLVQIALEEAGPVYYTIEGDFSTYDAS